MYYVIFDFEKNGYRYYLKFETEKEAYRFATCLMYCNHIRNSDVIMFSRIRVREKLKPKYTDAEEYYKNRVYEWVRTGHII